MNRLRTRVSSDEGAIAIIVGLSLVVLLTLVALVIDLGSLYDHDRELQTAADAGALAGAQELVYTGGDEIGASAKAGEYVDKNTSPNSHVVAENLLPWSPVVTDRSVTVDLIEGDVPFFFAPIIGESEGSVTAHAKAEVVYLTQLNRVFPVALNNLNPEKFVVDFARVDGNVTPDAFPLELTNDGDGTFNGFVSKEFSGSGSYTADLKALESDGYTDGVTLEDVGFYRVSDPSNPDEKLYRVDMSKDPDSSSITIAAEVAGDAFDPKPVPDSIDATLGQNKIALTHIDGDPANGPLVFEGSGPAPTKTTNDGWQAHDLQLKEVTGNTTVGRYTAFHPDAPLQHLGFGGTYSGHSATSGSEVNITGTVKTRVLEFGMPYVLKLGNQSGSGLYSGNWRIADIYESVNTRDEIGVHPTPEEWVLNNDLYIGGPLQPATGATVGQIKHGLSDRLDGHDPKYTEDDLEGLDDAAVKGDLIEDPYFVIVPIIDFASLHGTSEPYTIQQFAGFYITDYSQSGDINGVFVRTLTGDASGGWSQTKPQGKLYLETVVLTE